MDFSLGPGLAVLSLFAGLYGGLLGLGGGLVLVPGAHLLLGVPLHDAIAIAFSLAGNIPIATAALVRSFQGGRIRFRLLECLLGGALPGAILGAVLGQRLEPGPLRFFFGLFCIWACLDLGSPRRAAPVPKEGRVPVQAKRTALIGGLSGLLSGLLGIGGGTVTIPLLRRFCGIPVQDGVPHSHAVVIGASLAAAYTVGGIRSAAGKPFLPWDLLVWALPGLLLGGWLGGTLQGRLRSAALRRILAGVLLLAGLKMLIP
jgi:uncharacterized membrane protein YfcA